MPAPPRKRMARTRGLRVLRSPQQPGDDADVGFPQRFAKPPGERPESSILSVSSIPRTHGRALNGKAPLSSAEGGGGLDDSPSGKARSCNLRNPRFDSAIVLSAPKVLLATRGLAKAESPVRTRLGAPREHGRMVRRLPSKQFHAGSIPVARSKTDGSRSLGISAAGDMANDRWVGDRCQRRTPAGTASQFVPPKRRKRRAALVTLRGRCKFFRGLCGIVDVRWLRSGYLVGLISQSTPVRIRPPQPKVSKKETRRRDVPPR